MMITGAVLVIIATAILAFSLFMIGDEEKSLDKAVRFDGGAADADVLERLVIIEGKISVKNRILAHDFVDGAKEWYDFDADWSTLQEYRQPVLADLARGGIILNSDKLCTRAEGSNILNTDERSGSADRIRYIGLRRGDPIIAVGTLTSSAPAALAVKYWYSGSIAGYRNFLASSRKNGFIFFAVLASLGAGLFLWGFRIRGAGL
jgi:hypothetical protein